ncbi:MAG: hypothetical protein H7641_12980 [Candidatus Heimdallarchaeota archaeon]|nr:hypothetical protein [Candidatus Heimdallarchaeota archaeon]MCK4878475.1 hypothetical protein [Candidatus Heimdallarchaeota archaeon]
MNKAKDSLDKEVMDLEDFLKQTTVSEIDVKELQERNRVLLESLRKVKLLVERLLTQNRQFKRKVEHMESEIGEQNKKGVKMVSAARYQEMQKNADELGRSLPKLIKLIKLLNQENKLFKDKYNALENEFEDIINERDDLKEKIVHLNDKTQQDKIAELAELFPIEELADKVAKSIKATTDLSKLVENDLEQDSKTIAHATSESVPSFEEQARTDLQQVNGFSNEQISKLVDLVVEINEKIENLSGTMIVAAPARRRGKTDLDLSQAISDGDLDELDEPPERPDLEEVLDDILISG